MQPASIWKHKKYGKRTYSGHYRRDQNGEREFILVANLKSGKFHIISMESSVMAKGLGWVLQNPRKKQTQRRKK